MSLIQCPECGKEISNKAPACPNCGMPLRREDRGTYDVIVTRENQWFLINPAATIIVDRVDKYELKNGSSVKIPLSTGEHTLLFSLGPRKTEANINVTEDMKINMKMNRVTGEIDVTGYKLNSKTNTPNISIGLGGGFFKS